MDRIEGVVQELFGYERDILRAEAFHHTEAGCIKTLVAFLCHRCGISESAVKSSGERIRDLQIVIKFLGCIDSIRSHHSQMCRSCNKRERRKEKRD